MIYVTSFWLLFVVIIAAIGLMAAWSHHDTRIRKISMVSSLLLIPVSLYVFVGSLGWSIPCKFASIEDRTLLAFKADEQQGRIWLFLDGDIPLTCDIAFSKDNVSKIHGNSRDAEGRPVKVIVKGLSEHSDDSLEVTGRKESSDQTAK